MFRNPNHRIIFGIWLGWALIMLAYHIFLPARYTIQPPDRALDWTATETMPGSQRGKIYLNEPFLNRHVSWDSEYYLAIAVGGYEATGPARIRGTVGNSGTPTTGFWPFVKHWAFPRPPKFACCKRGMLHRAHRHGRIGQCLESACRLSQQHDT